MQRVKLKLKNLKLLDNFLDFCSLANRSDHTIISYKNDLQRFLFWYEAQGTRGLDKIKSEMLISYRHFLQAGGVIEHPSLTFWQKIFIKIGFHKNFQSSLSFSPLSVASTKRSLCTIKNFFAFLVESEGSIYSSFKISPIKQKLHQITLKDEDISHTKLLDKETYQKLREKLIRPKDLLILLLLYKGGLRIAELCALKLSSISPDGVIELIRKRGKRQRLKIDDFSEISYYLERYLKQNLQIEDHLFPGKDKKRPMTTRGMSLHLDKLLMKIGAHDLGLSPHSYRKSCATNLYHKTRDLLLVRNYLGHTDAKVTQTYIEY